MKGPLPEVNRGPRCQQPYSALLRRMSLGPPIWPEDRGAPSPFSTFVPAVTTGGPPSVRGVWGPFSVSLQYNRRIQKKRKGVKRKQIHQPHTFQYLPSRGAPTGSRGKFLGGPPVTQNSLGPLVGQGFESVSKCLLVPSVSFLCPHFIIEALVARCWVGAPPIRLGVVVVRGAPLPRSLSLCYLLFFCLAGSAPNSLSWALGGPTCSPSSRAPRGPLRGGGGWQCCGS